MERAASIRAEDLLEHGTWLREIARSLVADPQSADDLVQQAFITVMEHPPRHARGLRGWLSRVLTNAARQAGRADSRRARREHDASRPEALPSTAELVMAAELQREVVSSVLRLSEPNRTTILLRFHRDLTPARIAELQGVPAATVRSRLKRALEELRCDLDRQHDGGRGAWIAGLLPLARGAEGGESAAEPIAVLAAGATAKLTLAFIGAAILAAIVWTLNPSGPASQPPPEVVLAPPELAPVDRNDPQEPDGRTDDAAGSNPEARTAVETGQSGATVAAYHGIVTTRDGTPISGATLTLFPKDLGDWRVQDPLGSAVSDPDGRFRIPVPAGIDPARRILIRGRAEGFAESSSDPVTPEQEIQIKLPATAELFGRVLDADTGAPIQGATVSSSENRAKTDETGHYRLPGVLVGMRTEIAAVQELYARESTHVLLNRAEPTEHDIRLRRGALVRLQVFDAGTNAVMPGAHVVRRDANESLGTTDSKGELEARVAEGWALSLQVEAPGYATFDWSWQIEDTSGLSSIRIPMKGLAWIQGTVRDVAGNPVAGSYLYAVSDVHPSGVRLSSEAKVALGLPGDAHWQVPEGTNPGSDASGRFELPVVADPSPYDVHASHREYIGVELGLIYLSEPGQRVHLDVQLRKGARIRGQIFYNGEPWSRGSVVSTNEDGGIARAWVRAKGEYEISNVPPGKVSFHVRDSAGRLITFPGTDLLVEAEKEYRQDLEWTETLATITGQVLDARGAAVADVNIRAHRIDDGSVRQFDARTNADGTFSLRVAPDGVYDIRAGKEPATDSRQGVRAGTEGVKLVLADVGKLRLRLVDVATGAPVRTMKSDLWGLAWRKSGDPVFTSIREEIDYDGLVELELPVGIMDVAVHLADDGYAPHQVIGIPVTVEGNDAPIVVELTRGLQVKLSLKSDENVELFRAHLLFLLHESQLELLRGPYSRQGGPSNHRINGVIMWVAEPGLLHQLLEIGPTGISVLGGLAPGRYTLKSFPDDFVFEPATFELLRGEAVGDEKPTVEIRWRSR